MRVRGRANAALQGIEGVAALEVWVWVWVWVWVRVRVKGEGEG